MLVNQIAVFLENRPGRLRSLIKAVSDEGVNIQSLNIADTSDFGVVRMVTSDNEKAADAVKKAGFTCSAVDLVGVQVEDTPGSLANVLEELDKEGLQIEYLYSFTCSEGKTLILFKTENREAAQTAVDKHKI